MRGWPSFLCCLALTRLEKKLTNFPVFIYLFLSFHAKNVVDFLCYHFGRCPFDHCPPHETLKRAPIWIAQLFPSAAMADVLARYFAFYFRIFSMIFFCRISLSCHSHVLQLETDATQVGGDNWRQLKWQFTGVVSYFHCNSFFIFIRSRILIVLWGILDFLQESQSSCIDRIKSKVSHDESLKISKKSSINWQKKSPNPQKNKKKLSQISNQSVKFTKNLNQSKSSRKYEQSAISNFWEKMLTKPIIGRNQEKLNQWFQHFDHQRNFQKPQRNFRKQSKSSSI